MSDRSDARGTRFSRLGTALAGLGLLAGVFAINVPQAFAANAAGKVDPGLLRVALAQPGRTLTVIVRESVPASDVAENLVTGLHGTVVRELPIVGGFTAACLARRSPCSRRPPPCAGYGATPSST